jgi:hypothetical protein
MNERDRDTALAAVDEALASGRVEAEDEAARELQDLALAIEAESELPREEFARELGERVAAGFPRPRRFRAAPRLPRLRLPRARVLALAGSALTLVVVIGVAVSLNGERQTSDSLTAADAPETAPGPARVQERRFSEQSAQGPPVPAAGTAPGRVAPGEQQRRIERSASLTLAAPDDELDGVADSVVRVTDRYRGFVLSSSVASGDESDRGGSFELRIPADSLRAALRDLSRLGHVRSRREAGRDITDVYVSSRDRLTAAKAERRSLLRRLAGADSDGETEALRRRLDAVALRIERLRRELGAVRERTDYVAVSVDLRVGDGGGDSDDGGGGAGEAFDDSLGLLEGTLGILIRALGVLIPLALVGGLGWLGGALLRRRRREAALR